MKDTSVVKISLAAERMGISVKTIYNWISNGDLKMIHPGFVSMREVIRTYNLINEKRSEIAKERIKDFDRDHMGRFSVLNYGKNFPVDVTD
jgi:excisionase family DNA binding protein